MKKAGFPTSKVATAGKLAGHQSAGGRWQVTAFASLGFAHSLSFTC